MRLCLTYCHRFSFPQWLESLVSMELDVERLWARPSKTPADLADLKCFNSQLPILAQKCEENIKLTDHERQQLQPCFVPRPEHYELTTEVLARRALLPYGAMLPDAEAAVQWLRRLQDLTGGLSFQRVARWFIDSECYLQETLMSRPWTEHSRACLRRFNSYLPEMAAVCAASLSASEMQQLQPFFRSRPAVDTPEEGEHVHTRLVTCQQWKEVFQRNSLTTTLETLPSVLVLFEAQKYLLPKVLLTAEDLSYLQQQCEATKHDRCLTYPLRSKLEQYHVQQAHFEIVADVFVLG